MKITIHSGSLNRYHQNMVLVQIEETKLTRYFPILQDAEIAAEILRIVDSDTTEIDSVSIFGGDGVITLNTNNVEKVYNTAEKSSAQKIANFVLDVVDALKEKKENGYSRVV